LLVVIAIIGIIMTMAIPSMYRQINPDKASIQRAVNDIVEACRHARAQAILNRTTMEVRIRPKDGSIRIAPASSSLAPVESHTVSGEAWRMDDLARETSGGEGGGFSATLSHHIMIRAIRLNVDDDFTEEPEARVRFYQNGMSDEFSIVLQSEKDEYRMINLEVVTGLPSVETDPTKFVNYR
jgi:Tfp pilus assembly protein FimT